MKKTSTKNNAQALVEFILICIALLAILIGSYLLGKIILTKQTFATLNRLYTFKDTYGKNNLSSNEINSTTKDEMDTEYKFKKEGANTSKEKQFLGILGKISNFLASTKLTKIEGRLQLGKEYTDFLKTINDKIQLKESLFMDEDTFAHNNKLRATLYGIAFLKAGFSKDTKLTSIGKDLIDISKNAQEKENFSSE